MVDPIQVQRLNGQKGRQVSVDRMGWAVAQFSFRSSVLSSRMPRARGARRRSPRTSPDMTVAQARQIQVASGWPPSSAWGGRVEAAPCVVVSSVQNQA